MTVVAYREGTLAADTLVATERGTRVGYGPKIKRTPAGLVGVCGGASACVSFLEWISSSHPKQVLTGIEDDDEFEALLITGAGRVGYFDRLSTTVPDYLTADFHAIGIGREFAIGAMAMGATAEQAVAVAIAHNVHCGGEITVLRLAVQKRAIQSKRKTERSGREE